MDIAANDVLKPTSMMTEATVMRTNHYYLISRDYCSIDLMTGRRVNGLHVPINIDLIAKVIGEHKINKYLFIPRDATSRDPHISCRHIFSEEMVYYDKVYHSLKNMFGRSFAPEVGMVLIGDEFQIQFEPVRKTPSTEYGKEYMLKCDISLSRCHIRYEPGPDCYVQSASEKHRFDMDRTCSAVFPEKEWVSVLSPAGTFGTISSGTVNSANTTNPITKKEAFPKEEPEVISITVKKVTVNTNLIQ